MTEEQIRQESEHYAYGTDFSNDKPEVIAYKSFLSGAHSRNEEVNQWKESKNKNKVSGVCAIKVFLLCRRRGGKLKEGCIF